MRDHRADRRDQGNGDEDDDRAVPEIGGVVRFGPGVNELLPMGGRRKSVRILEDLGRGSERHHRDPEQRAAGHHGVDRDEQHKGRAAQLRKSRPHRQRIRHA